ncbi:DUF6906 family protein [Gorillibacterium sp. sgz5001074]|uniref:DUF6906 family protein n=1 Tax=Gorillibacterium sp. sgz5001074 TaxID=3446695 RepID=UPI003F669B2E
MKQEKKPTRQQKIRMELAGLNPGHWTVERDTPTELVIRHRETDTKRTLRK